MKKPVRRLLIAVMIVLLAGIIAFSLLRYHTEFRRTLITTFSNEELELRVYQIGDPLFPFGNTRGKLELRENGKKKAAYDFEVADDGANLQPENFLVSWHDAGVTVTICGSEQDPETIELTLK